MPSSTRKTRRTRSRRGGFFGGGSRSRASSRTPGWMWLATGLMLGAFVTGLFYINNHMPTLVASDRDQMNRHLIAAKKQRAPKFEFYNILTKNKAAPSRVAKVEQEHKVVAQQKQVSNPVAQEKVEKTKVTAARPSQYQLQIAALRNREDAETLKAKLAFLGYQADLKRAEVNGVAWHRVSVGPYQDKVIAQAEKEKLAQSHISSQLRKVS